MTFAVQNYNKISRLKAAYFITIIIKYYIINIKTFRLKKLKLTKFSLQICLLNFIKNICTFTKLTIIFLNI